MDSRLQGKHDEQHNAINKRKRPDGTAIRPILLDDSSDGEVKQEHPSVRPRIKTSPSSSSEEKTRITPDAHTQPELNAA
ncbi:hypothetical protein KCU81_g4293, partial [Aureobasidium melanogenum]|uniref:Uncharacterized protein n=1 Tax=Aureobasidium melanogenum (strain CBS 110374) TaxID=1043003 RepID=A0A074VPV8_AURM1